MARAPPGSPRSSCWPRQPRRWWSMVLTLRLRTRGWPHAWKYALGAFTLAIVAGAALARA